MNSEEYVKKQMACREQVYSALDMINANAEVIKNLCYNLRCVGNVPLAEKLERVSNGIEESVRVARDNYRQGFQNYIDLEHQTNEEFRKALSGEKSVLVIHYYRIKKKSPL